MRYFSIVGLLSVVGLSSGLSATSFAAQPSFDCTKAATSVEQLICHHDDLAEQDRTLSAIFRDIREKGDEAYRNDRLNEQRHWLQSRYSLCSLPFKGNIPPDREAKAALCLFDLTKARIAALKAPSAAKPAIAKAASSPIAKAASVAPPPSLARTLFPAQGHNETIATITDFGRYAVMVKSDQGTAVQLIDRMAGPSAAEGSAGHSDGRIDHFLDRGNYKIKLISDPRGSNDAELSIVPSVELNPSPLQLVEFKPVATALDDHQQRSYWLNIDKKRFVTLEAAGRFLDDLRLWKDGNWLVDAQPGASDHDPVGGQPMGVRTLALWLEPGLYRLVAYGGAGQKWSSGANGDPLYIRYGIPTLPDADRASFVASPFGIDRWLVPGNSNDFRVDTEISEPTILTVGDYDQDHPFDAGGETASIDKKSRDPEASLQTTQLEDGKWHLVTVERKPGAQYRLQYFDDSKMRTIKSTNHTASVWFATLQAGNGGDALDPTALVTKDEGRDEQVIAASVIELNAQTGWRRKFNLLRQSTVFLHADQPMEFSVGGTGADADYQVKPFIADDSPDYREPDWKNSGGLWTIDRGYWVLSIRPKRSGKGILDLRLRPTAMQADPMEAAHRAAPVFADLRFDHNHSYKTYLNETGNFFGGGSIKLKPLDLSFGTSFELNGGETLTLPITVPEAGRLDGLSDDGQAFAVSVDHAPKSASPMLAKGHHDVTIIAPKGEPRFIALRFTPKSLLDTAPLPVIDPARMAMRPNLPVVTADRPAYLDLDKDQTASFDVTVDKPSLYRVETSGIIETKGTIRTRTVTDLDDANANGIGRNFLIQQYLREGDYQVSVQPAGASHGPIGVAVAATPIGEFGQLALDAPARATLAPGQAGRYRFHLEKAGQYRLQTTGFKHGFTMRLDDADGWPILKPGSTADQTLTLEPGDYQMVLLPGAVESRAVTLLQHLTDPVALSGHGPFPIAFDRPVANRWMEPASGQPRTPDRWTFTLPAPASVDLQIDNGMRATITGGKKAAERTAFAERPWNGALDAGDYTIDAVSAAPNSRVDYTLKLASKDLFVGHTWSGTVPANIPVSIAGDRQVEFASFGAEDVKARLYDAAGKLVAANEDRDNDWNFLIPVRLSPGRYSLHVEPEGAETAKTMVRLKQPDESVDPPLSAGQKIVLKDGRIHIVPLGDIVGDKLLVVTAQAGVQVGIALEAQQPDGGWASSGHASGLDPFLALPVSAKNSTENKKMRARVWTIDHGLEPVSFSVDAIEPARLTERSLANSGVKLPDIETIPGGFAAASIALNQPGVLSLTNKDESLLWSEAPGRVAHRDGHLIVAEGKIVWLVRRGPSQGPAIKAERIDPERAAQIHLVLKDNASIVLPIDAQKPDTIDLWQVAGRGGQPGLAVRQDGTDEPPLMAIGASSSVQGQAVAIAPGPLTSPVLAIWNADGTEAEMPITLMHTHFPTIVRSEAHFGIADDDFSGQEANSLSLPKGLKRLKLTLPAGTVAVTMVADKPDQIILADAARPDILETSADRLLLLHADRKDAPFSIAIDAMQPDDAIDLQAGTAISRYSPTQAAIHLRADASLAAPLALHLGGSAIGARVLDANGMVHQGLDMVVSKSAAMTIDYRPGLFALDLHPIHPDPSTATDIAPTDVTLPSSAKLSGWHMRFHVPGQTARLLHVSGDMPMQVRMIGGAPHPILFDHGVDLNAMLPEKHALDLDVQPVGAAPLSGTLQFSSIELTPMQEGLGPKRRLAPGQSRAFGFTLAKAGTVGVGVRASVDIATCRLLNEDGREISHGLVSMQNLSAGSYVLVVDAPADGPAIDIEPALVGSVLPGNGPPEDVKASYRDLVSQKTP